MPIAESISIRVFSAEVLGPSDLLFQQILRTPRLSGPSSDPSEKHLQHPQLAGFYHWEKYSLWNSEKAGSNTPIHPLKHPKTPILEEKIDV